MGKFVSISSSDGFVLTKGEIGEDGVLLYGSAGSNCDYEVSSAGSYIDDKVCEGLIGLGVKCINLENTIVCVDVSPKYYKMFKWNGTSIFLLRNDVNISLLKDLCDNIKFLVYRGDWVWNVIERIVNCKNFHGKFLVMEGGVFVDSLKCENLRWDVQETPFMIYGWSMIAIVVERSWKIDSRIFWSWKKRIVQDGIRKRDIPGFERELIEADLEHLL